MAEIPDNVKEGLEIVPVRWIDRVLEIALERYPSPLADEEVAAVAVASPADTGTTTGAIKH